MPQFNSVEKYAARLLRKFPNTKNKLKLFYSMFVYAFYRETYRYKSSFTLKKISQEREGFFGYYDYSPVRGDYCIVNTANFNTSKMISQHDNISIQVLDLAKNEVVFETVSAAFNLQQGSRAHWLNDETITFNTHNPETKKLTSAVANINTGEIRYLSELCVQSSYKDEFYISLNYERLARYRPDYGYLSHNHECADLMDFDNDGLFRVDYMSGNATLLVSLSDIINNNEAESKRASMHWFNHVMISPNGNQMIFLHRFILNGMRVDHLYLYNFATGTTKLLNNHGMVSHCCWIDDKTVFGFMRGPSNDEKFHAIDCSSGTINGIPELESFSDGHPSCIEDYIVFDTYPGKNRMQHLFIYNTKTKEVVEIGEFFHGFGFDNENRCDLHPRFSNCGNKIYIDSVFDNSRQLYCLELM